MGLPVTGAPVFQDYLFNQLGAELGGKWDLVIDPLEHAQKLIAHIDLKRKELGIDKARERVLFDMEARRQIDEEVA